jgi:hypothetical protein
MPSRLLPHPARAARRLDTEGDCHRRRGANDATSAGRSSGVTHAAGQGPAWARIDALPDEPANDQNVRQHATHDRLARTRAQIDASWTRLRRVRQRTRQSDEP